MKKRDVLNSPRLTELRARRRQGLRYKILLVCLALFVVLVGVTFFFRMDRFNIAQAAVAGNKIIETEAITEVVNTNLQGYYLWLVPKSNFILYPKAKIKKELAEKFPRLKDITFSVNKFKTLDVSLRERTGKYIWCGESLPPEGVRPEESPCYFMDEDGYIFDLAPYFSGDVYFRFFGPREGGVAENPLGSSFAPGLFTRLITFKESLGPMGVNATSLYVKGDGSAEIYLSSKVLPPKAPRIYVKHDFDPVKVSENLQAALDTDPLKGDFKKKYSTFQYVDLRYGNKVYYKFSDKNSEPIVTIMPPVEEEPAPAVELPSE